MAIIMTLWIGNGAVLKSSSQWQLKEFWKYIIHDRNYLIFKILLIAIDWNFQVLQHLIIHKVIIIAIF